MYWDFRNAGQTRAGLNVSATAVDTMRTVTVSGWDAWDFGGDGDFPVLSGLDRGAQAVAIASGLTRLVSLRSMDDAEGTTLSFASPETLTKGPENMHLRLDFGYEEVKDGYCPSVAEMRDAAVGELRVEIFNGVVARLRVVGGLATATPLAKCKLRISGSSSGGDSMLELRIESADGSFAVSREYPIR